MEKVICFGLCDRNYIDMTKVALYSFYRYNTQKIKIFLTDDSSELYKKEFKDFDFFEKIEFIDFCKNSKTKKYIDKHYDDFKSFTFCFDKSGILNVTIANEVTDYMYEHYGKDYQVILRLDLDVIFFNSIDSSIDNFLKSGKRIGGSRESKSLMHVGRKLFGIEDYIYAETYLNAGNFMYRTDLMYHDQFNRMCNLFETIGFEKFCYFDQDSVNVMYKDEEKYDANHDGWIITCSPPSTYLKFLVKKQKPIFIHFVGCTKPFIDAKKYEHLNLHEPKQNIFAGIFPKYLEVAKIMKCSEDFCSKIQENYDLNKNWKMDDSSKIQEITIHLIEGLIKNE